MLGLTKTDPATVGFNEIFSAASRGVEHSAGDVPNGGAAKRPSFWPILTFVGFIFATPYLLMKLIGQVSTAAIEECKLIYTKKISIQSYNLYLHILINSFII